MKRVLDAPIYTSDQSIDRVLSAGLPVVLVFEDGQAPAALAQSMNSLAQKHADQLLVARVTVKDNPQSVSRYHLGRFPALVTVKDGQVFSTSEGIGADDLEAHTAYLLGKGPRPAERAQATGVPGQSSQPGGSRTSQPSGAGYSGARTQTASQPSGRPVAVTDASFEQDVMRSSIPVLVDFWAEWCGPCRMVDPILHKLAGEMGGRLKIAKLNVDENPLTAGRHGVQAIPTMMIVKDGRIVDRWSGAQPEAALRSRLSRYL